MKKLLLSFFIIILPNYFIHGQDNITRNNNTGNWDSTFTWILGDGALGFNESTIIEGNVTHDGNLTIPALNTLTIYDTLTITGDLNMGGSLLTVADTAILIVLGDVNGAFSWTDVGGIMVVVGDVNNFIAPIIPDDSSLYIFGDDKSIPRLDSSDYGNQDSLDAQHPDIGGMLDSLITSYLLSSPPTNASVDIPQYCSSDVGGSITDIVLSYSGGILGSTAVARWYSDPTFTTLEGSGQDLTISAPVTTTTYYVRYEGYNTTSAVSVTVQVDGSLGAIGAITGTTTVCSGTTGETYSVTPEAGASYAWTVPAGSSITSGQGTSSIEVTFGTNSGNVSVTATNTCSSVGPQNLAVTVNALPAVSAGSNSAICSGSDLNLTESGGEATSWSWSGPNSFSSTAQNPSIVGATILASGRYYVTISNGTCSNIDSVDVTVNAVPNLSTTTISAICNGDSYNLTTIVIDDANSTNSTYTYHSETPATALNELVSTTVSPTVNTTYYILGTPGSGCTGELAVDLLVLSSAPVDAGSITGNINVCQGESGVAYSISSITNAIDYIWSYTGTGATIIGSGTSITIDFDASATNGDLVVFGRNDCADGNSSSISINVNTGIPDDAGSITGTDNTCQGDNSVTYSIPIINGAIDYNWIYSGNGADLNISDNSVSINFASDATNGQLSVEGINSCGVGGASVLDITVNAGAPTVAGIISGSNSVCQGTNSVSYSIDPIADAVEYIWTYSGTGATINSSQNSITIDFDTDATSGELEVYGRNSCGDGQVSSLTITLNSGIPGDAGTITGTDNVCQGESSVSYSVAEVANASEYLWTYSGTGSTIIGMSNSATIDFDNNSTSGELTVQGSNGCGVGTISEALLIRVNSQPGAAGDISGESDICQGRSEINYEIDSLVNAEEYIWDYSGTGVTITGTSKSVSLNFDLDATEGALTVYGRNACGDGNVSSDFQINIKTIDECAESELGIISNVFTPNNDNVHDTWRINNIELFPNAKIEVFDRWGRKVFISEGGYNNDWKGTFDGKPLPMDNYFYVIDLLGNGEKVLNGNVTIVK